MGLDLQPRHTRRIGARPTHFRTRPGNAPRLVGSDAEPPTGYERPPTFFRIGYGPARWL